VRGYRGTKEGKTSLDLSAALLKLIPKFFGVGSITKHGKNSVQYRVSSPKDLKVIVDHISKYPLITQK
jgi:hypothetical protein